MLMLFLIEDEIFNIDHTANQGRIRLNGDPAPELKNIFQENFGISS